MKADGKKPLDNILAYRGFDLCNLPYTQDDVFAEPTQKRLQQTSYTYVPFLTYNNEVLDSLYSISQNSPTASGIIAQKTAYTIAGGLYALPAASNNPLQRFKQAGDSELSESGLSALNDYLKSVNGQNESMLDVIEKIAVNLWSFGNCFLEVYIIGGRLQFRVLSTYLCRPRKAEKGKLYPEAVGISEDWQENFVQGVNVYELPLYPEFKRVDGALRSIIHLKFTNLYISDLSPLFQKLRKRSTPLKSLDLGDTTLDKKASATLQRWLSSEDRPENFISDGNYEAENIKTKTAK